MTEEAIIRDWRSGLTAMQVAKNYMYEINSKLKKGEKKITKKQALAYVEPIIFDFETKGWNKCKKN